MNVPEDYASPIWTEGGRVHNWHNHVPAYVQHIWSTFLDVQKQYLASWAEELASNEHWE